MSASIPLGVPLTAPPRQTIDPRALRQKRRQNSDNNDNHTLRNWSIGAGIVAGLIVFLIYRARRRPSFVPPTNKKQALEGPTTPPPPSWKTMDLQTGDLLLMATHTHHSKAAWCNTAGIIKCSGAEPVNHVAIIIRDPRSNSVYAWEMVKTGHRLIDMNDLKQRSAASDVAVRRLQTPHPISFEVASRVCKQQADEALFDIHFGGRVLARLGVSAQFAPVDGHHHCQGNGDGSAENEPSERMNVTSNSNRWLPYQQKQSTMFWAKRMRMCSDLAAEWYQKVGLFTEALSYPCRALWATDFAMASPVFVLPWKPRIKLSWPPEPLSL